MDTRFPAIQELTPQRVRNAVRRALRTGVDAEMLGDFLTSVDWSTGDSADPAVKAMLGELEAWSTSFAEGDLTQAQYIARLLSLLPRPDERRRRAAMGDAAVAVAAGVEHRQPGDVLPR
jgi:hypothetical protein